MVLADRDQVLDLGLRDRRQVADLAEAEALRLCLEELDRVAHHVGDRGRAVEVADDASGGAGGAGAHPVLLEHEHVGAALGQPPGGAETEDAAADDHVARGSDAQLHGYGLCETGCSSPVAKRSKRNGCRSEECPPASSRAISRPTAIIL